MSKLVQRFHHERRGDDTTHADVFLTTGLQQSLRVASREGIQGQPIAAAIFSIGCIMIHVTRNHE